MPASGVNFSGAMVSASSAVEHQRLLVGVERENAALLDQRARQRLDEEALRQRQFERLAAALIAGLVMGDQRHHHLAAGPGMLGEIVDGLPGARAGARLRQVEAELRRAEQRMRRLARFLGVLIVGELEGGLGVDHAVVVVHLVVELERAARLRLGILGERDGRRAIGNGGEAPGQAAADALHGGGAVALDDEAALLAAGGERLLRSRPWRLRARPCARRRSCTPPVERTTSTLPTGTATAGAACAVSPGRKPGSITGGRPV